MLEIILLGVFLIIGFLAGVFIGELAYTPAPIGTLRVDSESDSDGLLVTLEIDRGHTNDLFTFDYVVCRVNHTPYISQK